MLFAVAWAAGWGVQESPLRWIREVPGSEADEDVRAVLVSTLRRAEGNVWEGVSVRALRGMCDQGLA